MGLEQKKKLLVFDAGPIISLTTNNLLWLLKSLKKEADIEFVIPSRVKIELVDKPLHSKKFKFEALQVDKMIRSGVIGIEDDPKIKILTEELLYLANHVYKVKGKWLKIVHYAEMEVLATQIIRNGSGVVIDERVARLLIENPQELHKVLSRHMYGKVFVDKKNASKFRNWTKNMPIMRSVELTVIAYEKGHLDKFLGPGKEPKKTLLESILWGVKIRGAAISRREIDEIVRMEISSS